MADDAISVTLSGPALDFVRTKVASGEFANAEEAILRIVDRIRLDEEEMARFEREEVLSAYEHHLAHPSSAIPIEQMRRELAIDLSEVRKAS